VAVQNLVDERPAQPLIAITQRFSSDRNANINHPVCNFIGDMLSSCETRRAETSNMLSTSGIGKASSKRSSPDIVGGFAVSDISETDVVDESGIELAADADLL
jgi:hypothetical protein